MMETHWSRGGFADLYIRRTDHDARWIANVIRRMTTEMALWELIEPESVEYSNAIRGEGLIIRCRSEHLTHAALAIAQCHHNSDEMYLANIVPHEGQMSADEYNAIANSFVTDLRRYSRRMRLGVRCSFCVPQTPTTLEQIVPGERTRALFESFMAVGNIWREPCISHPSDIERLDIFICAVHRWRSRVNVGALGRWLIREKQWPTRDADWVMTRIETGLEVLRVGQRF